LLLYDTILIPLHPPPLSPLFPYTTLFRSVRQQLLLIGQVTLPRDVGREAILLEHLPLRHRHGPHPDLAPTGGRPLRIHAPAPVRSEEHTSELQSRFDLVCRLLLEKKKNTL